MPRYIELPPAPHPPAENLDKGRLLYTVDEVAEILHCHVRSIWKWIEYGELSAARFGRKIFISHKALEAFIDSREGNGVPPRVLRARAVVEKANEAQPPQAEPLSEAFPEAVPEAVQ